MMASIKMVENIPRIGTSLFSARCTRKHTCTGLVRVEVGRVIRQENHDRSLSQLDTAISDTKHTIFYICTLFEVKLDTKRNKNDESKMQSIERFLTISVIMFYCQSSRGVFRNSN